tara:strand:- start:22659 stop:23048 length:390 start_codon:yes stop_codon:yes gene_type:complete
MMDLDKAAEFYNDVGVAAVEQIGDSQSRILIYAESDDGDLSVFVRYSSNDNPHVESLQNSDPVVDAVEAVWRYLSSAGPEHLWKSMEYTIDYGQVNISLSYDESFAGSLPIWEKSKLLREKHFPGKEQR